jgi:hypothetical protein
LIAQNARRQLSFPIRSIAKPAPEAVTVCDLFGNLQKWNGKVVTVTGLATFYTPTSRHVAKSAGAKPSNTITTKPTNTGFTKLLSARELDTRNIAGYLTKSGFNARIGCSRPEDRIP